MKLETVSIRLIRVIRGKFDLQEQDQISDILIYTETLVVFITCEITVE